MKAAVSIPDVVFKAAEKFARAHGRTRSRLYSDALQQYLLRHSADSVTEAMNNVCEAIKPEANDFVRAAGRRMMRREAW